MKLLKLILLILIMFILALSERLYSQEIFDLSYKYEKGKTYLYQIIKTSNVITKTKDGDVESKYDMAMKMRMEALDVVSDKYIFVLSIDAAHSKSSDMDGDSENNGENIVGKKIKMFFDKQGKKLLTIEIDKFEKPEEMDSPISGVTRMIQLPDKPLKAGDTWTSSSIDTTIFGINGQRIIKVNTEYKIEGKENKFNADCIKISFNSSIKIEGATDPGGFTMVLESSGQTSGTLYFDYVKGIVVSGSSATNQDINMILPDRNITIPSSDRSKTIFMYVEK